MARSTSRDRNARKTVPDKARPREALKGVPYKTGAGRGSSTGVGHGLQAVPNAPKDFTARVLSVVRRIPPGRVATYGDVAALAGRPRASRAVGNIMRSCGRIDVPCHRVIAAGGRLGGYGGDEQLKRSLLVAEGIRVSGRRVQDLDRVRVSGSRPRSR
jgi:O-6-methylguanine DNA methyltransferase